MSTFIFIFVRLSVPQKYASFKNKIKKKQIRCHFDIGISSEEEEMAVEMDHNKWGKKGRTLTTAAAKRKHTFETGTPHDVSHHQSKLLSLTLTLMMVMLTTAATTTTTTTVTTTTLMLMMTM